MAENVDGLVQDCSNSIANALELLLSNTKPSMCHYNSEDYEITIKFRTVKRYITCSDIIFYFYIWNRSIMLYFL